MLAKPSDVSEQPDFQKVIDQVLTKEKCTDCGICEAVCFLAAAGVIKNQGGASRTYDMEKCVRCGLCHAACPRTPFNVTPRAQSGAMGTFINVRSFKSTDPRVLERCQDGGVVTSLLLFMIDARIIDAVTVTKRTEDWIPKPLLTNSREDIIEAAGSKYSTNPIYDVLSSVRDITPDDLSMFHVKAIDDLRVGLTGLPCQMSGLQKVQDLGIFPSNIIKVKIGLFCFKNFQWTKLRDLITGSKHVKMETITKMQIKGDMMLSLAGGKSAEVKASEFETIANEGCSWCQDLTGIAADISCGNIGSTQGATTVITRTKTGADIIERARLAGYIEEVPLGSLAMLKKLSGLKLKKSKKDGGA